MSMKLFEIPVYALSKADLENRVKQEYDKVRVDYEACGRSEEDIQFKSAFITNPWGQWEYNHIIGYLVIIKESKNICFEYYTVVPNYKRYICKSNAKKFLTDSQMGGMHFYTGTLKSGEELREKLCNMMSGFVKEQEKKGHYIDLEAFNNISALLDYSKLLTKE